MKKILFLLLLTVVFGACESDTDSNWNNRPGGNSDDTQNWDSYVITVKNWERIGGVNADNSFFRCVVEDEYLDQYIFDKGSVMVYLIQRRCAGSDSSALCNALCRWRQFVDRNILL